MTVRYGVEVTGVCRICGRSETTTEMHHIISQARINKMTAKELDHLLPGVIRVSDKPLQRGLTIEGKRSLAVEKMPGNIVELCGGCHDMTTASESFFRYQSADAAPKESQATGTALMAQPVTRDTILQMFG